MYLYHLISSNSWCQKSCVRPSSSCTSRARYSGLPHFALIMPVSPHHSERHPDSLTLTLAPIRACSDLMRTPPVLHYSCWASLGLVAQVPHPEGVPQEDHGLLYAQPLIPKPLVLPKEGPRVGSAPKHMLGLFVGVGRNYALRNPLLGVVPMHLFSFPFPEGMIQKV